MAAFSRMTGSYNRRWLMTPSLTPLSPRGREHGVAIGQAGGHRLLDQDVDAGLARPGPRARGGAGAAWRCTPPPRRLRRASRRDRRTPARRTAPANARARPPSDVADGDELRLRQAGQRAGVDLPDLAAADEGGSHPPHQFPSGKYLAHIRRRNASDSAISSMPFMPSSMLIHPAYPWPPRMRKMAS